MAVLAAILPLVSQASALALALYRLAATDVYAAKELLKTARAVSNLALIAKEIGTFVNQDDRLPSPEVSLCSPFAPHCMLLMRGVL